MRVFLVVLVVFWVLTAHASSSAQNRATVSEISLEMVQGRVELDRLGRAFKVVLTRDGNAMFEGKANVKLIGKYRGKISEEEFDKLADSLISKKYTQIEDELPVRMSASAELKP